MPELLWEGKSDAVAAAKAVPYRLLEADDALSYGDADTENMIIQGDNLAALKALLPYYKDPCAAFMLIHHITPAQLSSTTTITLNIQLGFR